MIWIQLEMLLWCWRHPKSQKLSAVVSSPPFGLIQWHLSGIILLTRYVFHITSSISCNTRICAWIFSHTCSQLSINCVTLIPFAIKHHAQSKCVIKHIQFLVIAVARPIAMSRTSFVNLLKLKQLHFLESVIESFHLNSKVISSASEIRS